MRGSVVLTMAALAGAVLFWGVSFVWTKIVLAELDPFVLVFIRFSVATLLFLAVLMATGRGLPRLRLREHVHMALLALLQPFAYFLCETLGLMHTSASKASLIVTSIPAAVLLLSVLFLKERATSLKVLSVILSAAGVVLLVMGARDFTWDLDGGLLGDLLMLGAVAAAAGYMVLARGLGRKHSALEITFLQMAYGSVLFLPFFLWRAPGFSFGSVSKEAWTCVALLTVLCSFGAFLCYNFALSRVEASRASVAINCVPVVTVLTAWIVLGERLTLWQAMGGAVVLVAVLLPNVRPAGAMRTMRRLRRAAEAEA